MTLHLDLSGADMVEKIEFKEMLDAHIQSDPAMAANDIELPDPTRDEIADYIADMLQELRDLAAASGQAALGLLLEMAQREARLGLRRQAATEPAARG